MHALYRARYRTQLSIHDLLCTLELQICYQSVALKVRNPETGATERNELLVSTEMTPSVPAMAVSNCSSTSGMHWVARLTIPFFPRTLTKSTQTEAIIRRQTFRRCMLLTCLGSYPRRWLKFTRVNRLSQVTTALKLTLSEPSDKGRISRCCIGFHRC